MKKQLICFLFICFFVSCEKIDELDPNNENINGNSTLIATILNHNMPIGEGIKVITDPFTYELTTDINGQVEFEDIKAGKYDIYTYQQSLGSGKSTVTLGEEIQKVDIDFIQGVYITSNINIESPINDQGFYNGEKIQFIARIKDNITPIKDLEFTWESHLDGIIDGGSINEDGVITLTTSLSKGIHMMKLTVTNQLGVNSSASVIINTLSPKSLDIILTQEGENNVSINWNSPDTYVENYEVYRSNDRMFEGKLIATLSGDKTSYNDAHVPLFDSVYYHVKTYNAEGFSSKSNIVVTKGTTLFEYSPNFAEIHPDKPIIYFRVDNNKIIGINYEDQTIEVESTFSGSIGYFHVGNNGFGDELYIPNSDGRLYIYDLETLAQKEKINIGAPVYCVISNNRGLLYTSVSHPPLGEKPLRVYDRSTKAYVDGGGGERNTRLKLLPSDNEIIGISASTIPVDMDYYQFDNSGNILLHRNDSYHGDHPMDPDIYKIAPSNILITSSQGAIYSANSSMNYRGSLPIGVGNFSDFEFNANGTSIYASVQEKKLINIYSATSFVKTGEIKTDGYPLYLFRKGNELVVVSSSRIFNSYWVPKNIGFEIFQL